ncbi:hypothetical protein BC937DRAFT_94343 [Endogone sp. FLAS-F59071]|nr:hypothetical protein BC937DRAFT_94343 [Endogone sp. FLAS-F59071]|eukprot:RUS14099.1 hypothetical protein BC937DRAFT_94343 [Endogone sp. FLAS-F59071]
MCHTVTNQTYCLRSGCKSPVYVDANGRKYPFCSKTCARICGEQPKDSDHVYGTPIVPPCHTRTTRAQIE